VQTKDGLLARSSAKDAEGVLSTWRTSGMSMPAFAKSRGLKEQRLAWWKKRLREWNPAPMVSPERGPRFVPALLRDGLSAVGSSASVAIRFSNGTQIEIRTTEGVGAKWMRKGDIIEG
jgi:hypothetical protein